MSDITKWIGAVPSNYFKKAKLKSDSKRSSIASSSILDYQQNELTEFPVTTEICFLNWPGYNHKRMVRIIVAGRRGGPYEDKNITLAYNNSGKQRVVMKVKDTDGSEAISLVEFSSLEMFDVIDSLYNSATEEDPPGFIFTRFKLMTAEEWERCKRDYGNLNNWSIIMYEELDLPAFSLRIALPQDIPTYKFFFTKFR